MIKEIRDYIIGEIASVDSDLVANDSVFFDDDIGESLIHRSYQIVLNNITNDERTDYRKDSIEAIVSIFGFGYQQPIANYDELLDKALCIRNNIIDIGNFTGVGKIINIISNDVVATQLNGDDNAFKIDINLTIQVSYL